jgi:hypothetical protein
MVLQQYSSAEGLRLSGPFGKAPARRNRGFFIGAMNTSPPRLRPHPPAPYPGAYQFAPDPI